MPLGKKELFVTFRVEKSDYFKRDGADVHTEAEISISQAVLGGTIRIQGLYEDHTLQVSVSDLFAPRILNVTTSDYAWYIVSYQDKIEWKRNEKNRWIWTW